MFVAVGVCFGLVFWCFMVACLGLRVGGWVGVRYCGCLLCGFPLCCVVNSVVYFNSLFGWWFRVALLEVSWTATLCICVSVYLVAVGCGLMWLWWILSVGGGAW